MPVVSPDNEVAFCPEHGAGRRPLAASSSLICDVVVCWPVSRGRASFSLPPSLPPCFVVVVVSFKDLSWPSQHLPVFQSHATSFCRLCRSVKSWSSDLPWKRDRVRGGGWGVRVWGWGATVPRIPNQGVRCLRSVVDRLMMSSPDTRGH